jgi:hypothetical protein
MRVVAGRAGTHAFELLHADMYFFDADIVAEMGGTVNCHNRPVDVCRSRVERMLPDGRAARNPIFSYRKFQLFASLIDVSSASSQEPHGHK